MASMKLGSKSEAFYLDGHTWFCSTGLPSDAIVEVGEFSFHLHKFPLLSRSGVLENLIEEASSKEEKQCVLQLHDIPGGAKTFLLVAKFCYEVKIELNAVNIVNLRCAAEYLRMNEDYKEGNLIAQAENFLNEIFANWRDSIRALETCEEVLPYAEELHIVSRCINSLSTKACADPSLLSWPVSAHNELKSYNGTVNTVLWNGIRPPESQPGGKDDWWYEDVSYLSFTLFKRLILDISIRSRHKPERVSGPIMYYAKRHLPLMGRDVNFQRPTAFGSPDSDQTALLEELVELLPNQKGVMPTKFLLRLLKTSMILHANPSCKNTLEKRIGAQLDQAFLEDLLIPNLGYTEETLYDTDCVQRMLDQFMMLARDASEASLTLMEDNEEQLTGDSDSVTQMTMVANLVDGYLAEVAPDVNLKTAKFQALAAAIPSYARPLDDGIYRAIDIYLKAHSWLTDSQKEEICRLMNCQKLSLEASTHAAQNERLPLRVIVQVLFFEQLRLRTSVAGWFFVSDNLENSQNQSGNLALTRDHAPAQDGATRGGSAVTAVDDMKERVRELEKECLSMKQELDRVVKSKGSWNILRKLGF